MQGWFEISKAINTVRCIDWMNDNNHMVTSVDAGKAFNKFQYPFVMRAFNRVGIEGTGLNTTKP